MIDREDGPPPMKQHVGQEALVRREITIPFSAISVLCCLPAHCHSADYLTGRTLQGALIPVDRFPRLFNVSVNLQSRLCSVRDETRIALCVQTPHYKYGSYIHLALDYYTWRGRIPAWWESVSFKTTKHWDSQFQICLRHSLILIFLGSVHPPLMSAVLVDASH